MNRVLLLAYTAKNLGDDLFIKIICEKYSNTLFYLMAPREYRLIFKNVKNLKIVTPCKLKINKYIMKIIQNKCKCTIHIGGSLFIQYDNGWRCDFNNYKKRISGKPYFIIGSNFGPYTDNEYFTSHHELFSNARDICFRDKYSKNMFKDLPNVRQAPDIIFNYKIPEFQNSFAKIVSISVIDLSKRKDIYIYESIYRRKIVEIIEYFINNGYEVNIISYCELEYDNIEAEKILSSVKLKLQNQIKIYNYTGDIEYIVERIQQSEFVIATRFHAMILGMIFQKKVFPIIYSDKMKNVLDDIGFNGNKITIADMNMLDINMLDDYYYNATCFDVELQQKDAKMQFSELDKFLFSELE